MLKESFYLYKRLFPFIKPYWKRFVAACFFSIPLALCSAGLAYLVKPALDDVFLKKDTKMLFLIPLGLLFLYFVKGVFEYGYHYQLGFSGNSIIKDVRNRIYSHLQILSTAYFKKNPTGIIMSRITNDVNFLQRAINIGVIDIVKESFSIIGLTVVLFTQDPQLAGVAYLILPWASIPLWRFGKKSRKINDRTMVLELRP